MKLLDVSQHALLSHVLCEIEQRLNTKNCNTVGDFDDVNKPLLVAIDGCCGSGKSTCAKALQQYFGATVIHCDHFFLPTEMRTDERLGEIGGNIHYELLAKVLSNVCCGKAFVYQTYDCSAGSYVDRNYQPASVVVVEGSYALHPTLRNFYDVKVLLTVDSKTQYDRLLNREGANGIGNFVNKWIPLENRYFEKLDTKDCIIVDTK